MPNVTVTSQIATNAGVGDEGKGLLRDDTMPAAFLNMLAEKALFKDAIMFFGHAVPTDVTVQWAVNCIKEFQPKDQPAPKPSDPLPLCEQWLKTRSENDRFEANKSAKAAGMSSPAGMVAMAVFLAGKSMTPEGAPPAPPPAFAAEKMAAGAVRIAVLKAAPDKTTQNYNRALEIGKQLAKSRGVAYFATAG
jgi:hypothetical protein